MNRWAVFTLLLWCAACRPAEPKPSFFVATPEKESPLEALRPPGDCYIMPIRATYPMLYAVPVILRSTNTKVFVTESRKGTLNKAALSRLPHVVADHHDNYRPGRIDRLYRENACGDVVLYLNSFHTPRIVHLWRSLSIPRDRVKIVFLPDGVNAAFLDLDREAFHRQRERLERAFAVESPLPARIDAGAVAGLGFLERPDGEPRSISVISNLNRLPMGDAETAAILQRNERLWNVHPKSLYDALTPAERALYRDIFNVDERVAALFRGPKKKIVIITTSARSETKTEAFVHKLIRFYGDEFDYLYSIHPGHRRGKAFRLSPPPGINVSLAGLPFRVPVEPVLWTYDDQIHAVGGFISTAHFAMRDDKKRFFFEDAGRFSLTSDGPATIYRHLLTEGLWDADCFQRGEETIACADLFKRDGT